MMFNLNFYKFFSGIFLISSLVCLLLSLNFVLKDISYFFEWSIFQVMGLESVMGLYFDWMCLMFLSVVSLISGSIFMYCNYYMAGEINYLRFIFVLLSFIGSMWLLIISPNLISLLLGWDGLGLSSYILVIFYQNESSGVAGMLTVLMNRVGDVSILMGISLMSSLGSFSYSLLNKMDWVICLFVSLAAMTKSAQIPFSAWLPAAMAAPTPVSSLVHSSTLVTAGVYLLIRFNYFLMMSGLGNIIMWVGVLTMFMSGLGANLEGDLKKVVALSTLSQLGLMFMILGWGKPVMAFFHLITHALFKSSLFMCVGFMIHSVGGSQDSRSMMGLIQASPVLGICLGLSNMALCGFPFLAGFYSKDMILESMNEGLVSYFLIFLIILSTGFTVSYSVRLLSKSLGSMSEVKVVSMLSGMDGSVLKSLSCLISFSCIMGYGLSEVFCMVEDLFVLSVSSKYSVLSIILVSSMVSVIIFTKSNMDLIVGKNMKLILYLMYMWGLSVLSGGLNNSFFIWGQVVLKGFDAGWLEYYGGVGSGYYLSNSSNMLQMGQKSVMVVNYLISMFMLALFCLILLYLWLGH